MPEPDNIQASDNDDTKTLTSAGNLEHAVPPDTDKADDELETTQATDDTATAKFVPNDTVFSHAHNSLAQVVTAEPANGSYMYHVMLIGNDKVAKGAAICAESDLELRRDKAAKAGRQISDATVPVPRDQAIRAERQLEVLAKACENQNYHRQHDAATAAVEDMIGKWGVQSAPQHEQSAIQQMQDSLSKARRAYGELDGPAVAAAIDGALQAVRGITDSYAAQNGELDVDVSDSVSPEDEPSMQSVTRLVKSCRDKLADGDPEFLKSALDVATQQLARIETSSPNAARTVGLMKGLVNRAARQLSQTATLITGARSDGVGHPKGRQQLSNALAQAAFLGDMAMRRQAVRSIDDIAAANGISIKTAYRLLVTHNLLRQDQVEYTTESENPQERCRTCRWYSAGLDAKNCYIVWDEPEPIVPDGWCNRWEQDSDD